jgi:hypothetical protein
MKMGRREEEAVCVGGSAAAVTLSRLSRRNSGGPETRGNSQKIRPQDGYLEKNRDESPQEEQCPGEKTVSDGGLRQFTKRDNRDLHTADPCAGL